MDWNPKPETEWSQEKKQIWTGLDRTRLKPCAVIPGLKNPNWSQLKILIFVHTIGDFQFLDQKSKFGGKGFESQPARASLRVRAFRAFSSKFWFLIRKLKIPNGVSENQNFKLTSILIFWSRMFWIRRLSSSMRTRKKKKKKKKGFFLLRAFQMVLSKQIIEKV